MNYRISYEQNPKPEDIQILNDGISEQAKQKKEMNPLGFFAFFIRDENEKIIGGCNACNLYGCLYIDQLWLEKSLRGKGYGKQLMQKAEDHAKQSGLKFKRLVQHAIILNKIRILGCVVMAALVFRMNNRLKYGLNGKMAIL